MKRLFDLYIGWTLKERRWPLLFPFPIFLLFIFTWRYFDLSFRQTTSHWFFWTSSGIIIILAGFLYWIISPQTLVRRLTGFSLIFAGLIILFIGISKTIPPSLPEDKLVIIITRFTPISTGAEEEADNISHRIEQTLRERQRIGLPLEIKRIPVEIVGTDEQSKQNFAIELCKTKEGNSHLIVWGEIRKDEEELYIEPRITVARQLHNARIEERKLGSLISYEPKNLQFKKRLSNQIADVVMLIYGLAYYKAKEWDKSINILDRVQLNEGYLIKGLCLIEKAQQSENPIQYLQASIKSFENIVGVSPIDISQQTDAITLSAYFNKINATTLLALTTQSEDFLSSLWRSAESYKAMLNVLTRSIFPQDWALTKNNLGIVLRQMGIRVSGSQANKLLEESIDEYKNASQVYKLPQYPYEWAMVHHNLGNALSDLGIRVSGVEGNKLLLESLDAYKSALKIYTRSKFPLDWASTKNCMGTVYRELGTRIEGKEGNKRIHEAIKHFQDALQIFTQKKFPQDWVGTQINLANALGNLGDRLYEEKGNKYLWEAIDTLKACFKVCSASKNPLLFANTNNNLGNVLRILGVRIGGQKGNNLFREAIKSYKLALEVYARVKFPQDWAMTQNNLCTALSDLGSQIVEIEGDSLLVESIFSCSAALQVFTKKDFPQEWARTQHNLGCALFLMGIRLKDSVCIEFLNKTINAYKAALEIRTRDELPQQWAMTQGELGRALMVLGIKVGNNEGINYLNEAIYSFDNALLIYDAKNFPQYHKEILAIKSKAIQFRDSLVSAKQ